MLLPLNLSNIQLSWTFNERATYNKSILPLNHLIQGRTQRCLKTGEVKYRPAWLAREENIRFHMIQKGRSNVRNYRFLEKIFISVFSNFLHFYSQNFIIFSKFTNALTIKDKKTYTTVNEKRKAEKYLTLFYSTLFYKAL